LYPRKLPVLLQRRSLAGRCQNCHAAQACLCFPALTIVYRFTP
jgi:hypothetical protein